MFGVETSASLDSFGCGIVVLLAMGASKSELPFQEEKEQREKCQCV
jgi:hypothetical protein